MDSNDIDSVNRDYQLHSVDAEKMSLNKISICYSTVYCGTKLSNVIDW